MAKRSIVLLNLGGPDRPESVQPFLNNLFNDPAIIGLPAMLRLPLAKFISTKRAPIAREIYGHLGGKSPLLPLTEEQAAALSKALTAQDPAHIYKVFIAMRSTLSVKKRRPQLKVLTQMKFYCCHSIRNIQRRLRPRPSLIGKNQQQK